MKFGAAVRVARETSAVGRLKDAAERSGISLEGGRTAKDDVGDLLEISQADDPNERRVAVRNLCTCQVKADDDLIWSRLLELLDDVDAGVRRDVLHSITDSTPTGRVDAVVQALEARRNDPDDRLRRRIRKTLAHYHRTGKITDAAG